MRNLRPNKASGCWQLRITRDKVLYQENFSVKDHGSWEAAEKAGLKRLKELLPNMPPKKTIKGVKTRRNTSGVVGVRMLESVKEGEHNSWRYLRWQASWPGNRAGSSWGIDKYGDHRAFICACIARHHETNDRQFIESEYKRLKGSAQVKKWLSQKSQEPK